MVANGNKVWELALRGKVARDAFVECRESSELKAIADMRVEDYGCLMQSVTGARQSCRMVGITADENHGITFVFVCVRRHLNRKIDIRLFFFGFPNRGVSDSFTRQTWLFDERHSDAITFVESFDDLNQGVCREYFKVTGLIMRGNWHMFFTTNSRSKVFDGNDFVFWSQKRPYEFFKVKPKPWRTTEKPVEKIETIYIDDRFHGHVLVKTLEPGLLPAPHRIAVAQRVDVAHQGA